MTKKIVRQLVNEHMLGGPRIDVRQGNVGISLPDEDSTAQDMFSITAIP
jgi:hypothetical protein